MNASQQCEQMGQLLGGEQSREARFVIQHLLAKLVQLLLSALRQENALATPIHLGLLAHPHCLRCRRWMNPTTVALSMSS